MNSVEYVYYSLIITGLLVVIITFGLSSIVGYIVGYSFILAGFFFLGGYLLLTMPKNTGFLSALLGILPFICIIAVIVAYLVQIGKFKDRITNGHISSSYYSFSNIFLILIFLQSYVFYTALQDSQFKETHTLNKVYSGILNILSLFSAMTVITIYIILAFYSTDG